MPKIKVPKYTKIPNVVFDYWFLILKPSARILLLIIFRRIFEFDRVCDQISKSQLCKISGLSKNTVNSALKELESYGLIVRHKKNNGNNFDANSYMIDTNKILKI